MSQFQKEQKINGKVSCLGNDINWRTGLKASSCISLNQEEFKALIQYKPGVVSSFVMDVVKTMIDAKEVVFKGIEKKHKIEYFYEVQDGSEFGGKLLMCKEMVDDDKKLIQIKDSILLELTLYRTKLGSANFFKIFRTFYFLANIPKEA